MTNTLPRSAVDPITDELIDAEPMIATEEMPHEVRATLAYDTGPFIGSRYAPDLHFTAEPLSGATGIWQVRGRETLLTAVPGQGQTALDGLEPQGDLVEDGTEGFRPPWADVEFVPRLLPFRARLDGDASPEQLFLEPVPRRVPVTEAKASPTLPYPFRTVGKVIVHGGSGGPMRGTGVLVGPNLMVTAGHGAPWGAASWSMEFIPAHREGQPPAFGNSFVSEFRGWNTGSEVSGIDMVICRLFRPLGNAVGWMGTQWFNDEDRYEALRYASLGYPLAFGDRQALEPLIRITDIDNDSPGLELEVPNHHPLGRGWSGGPLFFGPNDNPTAVGVLSGSEKDELDPRRSVFAGGRALVDLVKFGLANWRP